MSAVSNTKMSDTVLVERHLGRPLDDNAFLHGFIKWEMFNAEGELTGSGVSANLITQVGDQIYGERGGGVASALAAPTGMKLGGGSTAVAKTGAGAALVTYLATSNKAFDATFPASSLSGSSRRIQYKRTYAAGEATTASAITEAAITNDTIATDATSTAANTMSRVLLTGIGSKGASDTLVITWNHDLLGA